MFVVVPVSWVSVATIMSGEIDSVVSARVLRFLNMDWVLTTSILNVFFIGGISLGKFCAALGDEVWRGLPGSSSSWSGSDKALYLLASGTSG